jgi:hypothetical protein
VRTPGWLSGEERRGEERSGVEWSTINLSKVKWSEVKWSEVKWSEVKWSVSKWVSSVEGWQFCWARQETLRRDGAIVELSVESQPVKRRLGGWCERATNLGVVSSVELFNRGWEEMALQLRWQLKRVLPGLL